MTIDCAFYGFLAADADARTSKAGKPWVRLRVGVGGRAGAMGASRLLRQSRRHRRNIEKGRQDLLRGERQVGHLARQ